MNNLLPDLRFLSLGGGIDASDPLDPPTLVELLQRLLPYINGLLFGVAPVLLVVMIVMAGIKRLMAADNPKAVEESTGTLMWAIIGYAVILLSYLIVRLGASLLGFDIGTSPQINLDP